MIKKESNLVVIGLGHIGLPLLVHYSRLGYCVSGVDIDAEKVIALKKGDLFFQEEGISGKEVRGLNISSEISFSNSSVYVVSININEESGHYQADGLFSLLEVISSSVSNSAIVIRSTISPEIIEYIASNMQARSGNGIYYCPEFLREGCALSDLSRNPEYLGAITVSADHQSVSHFNSTTFYDPCLLSFLKVSNNAWRATKVSFANLMMLFLDQKGLDIDQFYQLFTADTLNVSKSYLKPGAPFGGYCLPKETKIFTELEKQLPVQFFQSVMDINEKATEYWVQKIFQSNPSIVVFESIAFKSNTNDERCSPYIQIRSALESLGISTFTIDDDYGVLKRNDVYVTVKESSVEASTRLADARVIKIAGL